MHTTCIITVKDEEMRKDTCFVFLKIHFPKKFSYPIYFTYTGVAPPLVKIYENLVIGLGEKICCLS